jgi:DMSO/TMAO reductase YedYZ molybdopterin-dependent catalytic subunit
MDADGLSLHDVTRSPHNAEAPLPVLLEPVTPSELVYVRNHFDVPALDAATWRLGVGGAVERPLSLSLGELQALPRESVQMTLECAGNGRLAMRPVPKGTAWSYGAVSVVRFTGTPLRHVLARARIAADAVEVAFAGADRGEVEPGRLERFVRSLPLEAALRPDTLLAWEMNGLPLPSEHGRPLRLVVPGWYGMASVKWLEEIRVLTEPFEGFFQSEHYVYVDGDPAARGEPVREIRVRAVIAEPADGATLALEREGESVEVCGAAWSGHGPVARVEVSADGGASWTAAEVEPARTPHAPQRWWWRWVPPSAGSYTLLCRAADAAGESQPAEQVWNRLGYGNNGPHAVVVRVARPRSP